MTYRTGDKHKVPYAKAAIDYFLATEDFRFTAREVVTSGSPTLEDALFSTFRRVVDNVGGTGDWRVVLRSDISPDDNAAIRLQEQIVKRTDFAQLADCLAGSMRAQLVGRFDRVVPSKQGSDVSKHQIVEHLCKRLDVRSLIDRSFSTNRKFEIHTRISA